ncbi:MAG TPA: tetratricopeptide repeat protein [Micropepsaceae bacterium]|nr:tetratricopeptide repeat protein [Micropepsaceae bacterium]
MSYYLLQDAQRAYQEGRLADAAGLYHEFLNANPAHVPALYELGMIYFRGSQFDSAERLFGEIEKLDPGFADGLCMRGVSLVKMGRTVEALALFEQALRVKPDFVEAMSNHATALLQMGRYRDGLEELDRVLTLDPDHVLTLNNRGNALFALNRYQEAVESYDRALAIYPEFPDARQNRLLALGELNRGGPVFPEILCAQGEELMRREQFSEALPRFEEALTLRPDFPEARALHATAYREAYRRLFDESAPLFEESLLSNLNYRGHLQLREMADRVWPGAKTGVRILDLGCGTGLVGEQFKTWAAGGGRLDGIDFSTGMLDQARNRSVYNTLYLGDIEQMLAGTGESYDLILAADTLIYFGDLKVLVRGAAQHLLPGGFFIFTVESKDGEGWEPTPKRRFRHSEAYLRECAAEAGLEFVERMDCTLRFETGAPVPGFVVVLKK